MESSRRREASPIARLRDLHFAFFSGTPGLTFNGYVAFALVFLSSTGLGLWIVASPKKQRFRLSLRGSWKSVIWNMHRQMGLLSLSLLILVSITGAYYAFRDSFLKGIHTVTGSLPPRGSPPVSVPPDGFLARSIDEIAAASRTAVPDARLVALRIPAQPTQAWAATFHREGGSGESADSGPTAFIDPFTLKTMRIDDIDTMPFGARVVKSMEPVHYGKFGGVSVKVLWVFLGFLPLMFSVSGAFMWWNRTGGFRGDHAKVMTETSAGQGGPGLSAGGIPEWLRFADPLQSKVARERSLVCHSRRSETGVWGAKHSGPSQNCGPGTKRRRDSLPPERNGGLGG